MLVHASRRFRPTGFTLVELMVVMAIVGVGGGLALVNMSEQVAAARRKADGHAMLERIRQEHRISKEHMNGMLLSAVIPNELRFQQAEECIAVPGAPEVRAPFLPTTQLVLSGASAYCWDERGQPQVQPDVGLPPPPPKPKKKSKLDASEVASLLELPGMGIFVDGSSDSGELTSVVVSQTGVSSGVMEKSKAADAQAKVKKIKEEKRNGRKKAQKSERK